VSYQVFARKYRPRTFDDVLGQDHVVRTLRNAITQGRLAHAYLFVGPRGTGKTSTARIFAKALNCPGGPMVDFDPDNELCVEIEKGICLDVREIDGASNNGVEQVRELREEVKFAPSRCRYKIYYIDEVHMLSTAAFNALLKTLEEPPEHVKFIFATTEAHKVLPTIISRCQRFDLRRIPANLIAKHLLHIASLEGIALSEQAAYAIAKGADGGMRDAQSMLDQLVAFCGETIAEQDVLDIFGLTRGETVANLALRVLDQDTVGGLQELHSQADGGKDLSRLLIDLIQHFRTLLVHQVDAPAAEEDLSPELTEMVRAQSAMVQAEALLRVMDGLAEVESRMRWASNKLLHMEIGIIQAVQTLGEVSLSEVIAAIGTGGEIAPRRAAATPAPRPVAAVLPVRERTPDTFPVQAAAPAATPAPAPVVRAVVVEAEAPVFIREQPAPVAPTPAPAPAARPAAPAASSGGSFSLAPETSAAELPAGHETPEAFWKDFMIRIDSERPLVVGWLDHAVLLSLEARNLKIGVPETETAARDNLLRAPMRKYLEGVITEMVGRPIQIDVVLDASLQPPPASEMSFGFGDLDTPAPKPEAGRAPEPAKAEPVKPALSEDFYKDPLIQAALVKFKATLVE